MTTRHTGQLLLGAISATSALLLLLFFFNLDLARDERRPEDPVELARWISRRPADWLAASALADRALDAEVPRRRDLWRASYALAENLAPERPNTAAGFVRGGLFHWYELDPRDRKAVLDVAARLMRDPSVFTSMHQPLWQLTRDFAYLRRVAPPTMTALTQLRDLAVLHGRFQDYRELRESIRAARLRLFEQKRATLAASEMIDMLPSPLDTRDIPLAQAILQELDRRAFDAQATSGRIESLATFAIEHQLQPLGGLEPFVETRGPLSDATRARLALAMGNIVAATRIEMTTAVSGAKEWVPYYLARAAHDERSGNAASAAAYRARAAFTQREPQQGWMNTCGANELCTSVYQQHDGPLHVAASISQSDEVPPYVEIYVDDALTAEGDVNPSRVFDVEAAPGPHRTEIRLVNPRTRNGIQRRVRLS
ncbi:MAG: hypothetical protein M3Q69_00295 [Acidobacteriota bacterium]|nr:hypothetical protein [Acidobacteriota bacterium]